MRIQWRENLDWRRLMPISAILNMIVYFFGGDAADYAAFSKEGYT